MTRSTSPSTYDDDFFAWTQEQAKALRRAPAAAFAPHVDIAHIAEEIEDLGKRDLREVTSFLARLFEHLIKLDALPTSIDVPHWLGETLNFQISAAEAFSPSMRKAIDLDRIWRQGMKRAEVSLNHIGVVALAPAECPFGLDELLIADFDIDAALAKLDAAKSAAAESPPRRDVP